MLYSILALEMLIESADCFVQLWSPYYIHIIQSTETPFINRDNLYVTRNHSL
jgi:hypothetical protein